MAQRSFSPGELAGFPRSPPPNQVSRETLGSSPGLRELASQEDGGEGAEAQGLSVSGQWVIQKSHTCMPGADGSGLGTNPTSPLGCTAPTACRQEPRWGSSQSEERYPAGLHQEGR